MANGIEATFNIQEVMKALKQLPVNIQKNVMVGATRAGAKVVSDEAKRLVDKKTHNLEKSIGITKRRSKNRNIVSFSISPRKGGRYDGFYGRFKELGTSKMNAKPFLRPAAENSVDATLEASKEYIAKRLPAEIVKAKR